MVPPTLTALNLYRGGNFTFSFTPDNPDWRSKLYSIKLLELGNVRDFYTFFDTNTPGVISANGLGYGSAYDIEFIDYEFTFSATGYEDKVIKVTIRNK